MGFVMGLFSLHIMDFINDYYKVNPIGHKVIIYKLEDCKQDKTVG